VHLELMNKTQAFNVKLPAVSTALPHSGQTNLTIKGEKLNFKHTSGNMKYHSSQYSLVAAGARDQSNGRSCTGCMPGPWYEIDSFFWTMSSEIVSSDSEKNGNAVVSDVVSSQDTAATDKLGFGRIYMFLDDW